MTLAPSIEAPPFPGPIRKPQRGDEVRTWQKRMKERGWHITADGIYGDISERLCRNFQAEKDLEVTGVVDERTWEATWTAMSTHAPPFPGRVLRQPPVMEGRDVRQWQEQMNKRGWPIVVDGFYGPDSEAVCRQFQAERFMVVDGDVGRNTWTATWTETV